MDDLTTTAKTLPKASISAEERERRKKAIDYARASLRLEGFIASADEEEIGRRYIEGEISTAEHTAALHALHGL